MIWLLVALLMMSLAGCAPDSPPAVTITWSTASGMNTAGFVIDRSETAGGPFERVSALIVAGADPFVSHEYQYTDRLVRPGKIYFYKLITIHNDNSHTEAGQLSATAG